LWLLYTRPVPVSDFQEYRDLAAGLLDHGQYGYPTPTAFRFPGYPAFLAILMLVSRSDFWLSLGTVALAPVTAGLLYAFATRATRGDRRAAFWAAIVYALYPSFVYLAPVLASEHLLAPLILGAACVLLSSDMKRWLGPAATGVFAAAAVLTRGEAVFYVPVFAAVAALRAGSKKNGLIAAAIVGTVATTGVLPWVIRNNIVVGPGAGLSTNAGYTLYAVRPHSDQEARAWGKGSELDRQSSGFSATLRDIAARPFQLVEHALDSTKGLYNPPWRATAWSIRLPRAHPEAQWPTRNLRGLEWFKWLAVIAYLTLVALALLSLRVWSSLTTELRVLTVGLIAANWFCYGVVFLGGPRYRYIQEVCFCVLAGIVITNLGVILRPERDTRAAGAV
jgi:hypothetical protein